MTYEEKLACRNLARWLSLVEPVLGPATENGGGYWGTSEWCFPCPLHSSDRTGNGLILSVAKFDPTAPRWWCRKCDANGVHWSVLLARLAEVGVPEEALPLAAGGSAGASTRHTPTAVPLPGLRRSRRIPEPLPTEDQVAAWADGFASTDAHRYLVEQRSWSPADIKLLQIGWHYGWQAIALPVRDESSALVNVRLWDPRKPRGRRWRNWRGHGADAPLWPMPRLATAAPGSRVYLCAGEPDAMAAMGLGAVAVTTPRGEGTPLRPADVEAMAGLHVIVVYDSDSTGRAGARAAVRALRADGRVASASSRDLYPRRDDGSDLTDWIRAGHSLPLPVPTKKRSAA